MSEIPEILKNVSTKTTRAPRKKREVTKTNASKTSEFIFLMGQATALLSHDDVYNGLKDTIPEEDIQSLKDALIQAATAFLR